MRLRGVSRLLPIEEIRRMFAYEPETGIVTWRIHAGRCGRFAPGAPVGSKRPEGYLSVRVGGRASGCNIAIHRLAWAIYHGEWPENDIDHINGNRADNRLANLRHTTPEQSAYNRMTLPGRHGTRGVHQQANGRFQARIGFNRRIICLGTYDTAQEAHQVYLEAAKRLFGDYMRREEHG